MPDTLKQSTESLNGTTDIEKKELIVNMYPGLLTAFSQQQRLENLLAQPLIGRDFLFKQINEFIRDNNNGTLLISASAGFGKSVSVANWLKSKQREGLFLTHHFFSNDNLSVFDCYSNLLRQLYGYYEIEDERIPETSDKCREKIFQLISSRGALPEMPLILILDGIDEADKDFRFPFSLSLPTGVFVIITLRTAEDEDIPITTSGLQPKLHIKLGNLNVVDVTEWIELRFRATGDTENLAALIVEKTGGFPLYLKHFFDESLNTGTTANFEQLINKTPTGFEQYVKDQFKLLAQDKEIQQKKEIQLLFALLAVSVGPLSERDIEQILSVTSWELASLPWKIKRWLTVNESKGFKIFSLSHPLLAQVFSKILGSQSRMIELKLLNYCSDWNKQQSEFIFRNYIDQLIASNALLEAVDLLTANSLWVDGKKRFFGNYNDVISDLGKTLAALKLSCYNEIMSAGFKLGSVRDYISRDDKKYTEEDILMYVYLDQVELAVSIALSRERFSDMLENLLLIFTSLKHDSKYGPYIFQKVLEILGNRKFLKENVGKLIRLFDILIEANCAKELSLIEERILQVILDKSEGEWKVNLIFSILPFVNNNNYPNLRGLCRHYLHAVEVISPKDNVLLSILATLGDSSVLNLARTLFNKTESHLKELYPVILSMISAGSSDAVSEILIDFDFYLPNQQFQIKVKPDRLHYYYGIATEFAKKGQRYHSEIWLKSIENREKKYRWEIVALATILAEKGLTETALLFHAALEISFAKQFLIIYIECLKSDKNDDIYSKIEETYSLFEFGEKVSEENEHWLSRIIQELQKYHEKYSAISVKQESIKRLGSLIRTGKGIIEIYSTLINLKLTDFANNLIENWDESEVSADNYRWYVNQLLKNGFRGRAQSMIKRFEEIQYRPKIYDHGILSMFTELGLLLKCLHNTELSDMILTYTVKLCAVNDNGYKNMEQRIKLANTLVYLGKLPEASEVFPGWEDQQFGIIHLSRSHPIRALNKLEEYYNQYRKSDTGISRALRNAQDYFGALLAISKIATDETTIDVIIQNGKTAFRELISHSGLKFDDETFTDFIFYCLINGHDIESYLTGIIEYLHYFKVNISELKDCLLFSSLKFGLLHFASTIIEERTASLSARQWERILNFCPPQNFSKDWDRIRELCNAHVIISTGDNYQLSDFNMRNLNNFLFSQSRSKKLTQDLLQLLFECWKIQGCKEPYIAKIAEIMRQNPLTLHLLSYQANFQSISKSVFVTPTVLERFYNFASAEAFFRQGDFESATKHYLNAGTSPAFKQISILRCGITNMLWGDGVAAEKNFLQALESDGAYTSYCRTWLMRLHCNFIDLASLEKEVLGLMPDEYAYNSWMPIYLLRQRKFMKTIECTEALIKQHELNQYGPGYELALCYFYQFIAFHFIKNEQQKQEALDNFLKQLNAERFEASKNHLLILKTLFLETIPALENSIKALVIEAASESKSIYLNLTKYVNLANDLELLIQLGFSDSQCTELLREIKTGLTLAIPHDVQNRNENRPSISRTDRCFDELVNTLMDANPRYAFVEIIIRIDGRDPLGRDAYGFVKVNGLTINPLFNAIDAQKPFTLGQYGEVLIAGKGNPIPFRVEIGANLEHDMIDVPLGI